MSGKKTVYVVEVVESKSYLPGQIDAALPEKFSFQGLSIEAAGDVTADKTGFIFNARGSGQKYSLTVNEELKKLLEAGKTAVTLSGKVTEPEEKDGKKPLPVIEVTSAKERSEKK